MSTATSVTEVDLNAFVDGELAPERRPLVEVYLAAHPSEAGRMEGWRRQNELIRAALGRVSQDPPAIRAGAHGQPVVRLDPSRATALMAQSDAAAPIRLPDARPAPVQRLGRLSAVIAGSFLAGAGSAVVVVMLFGLMPNLLSGFTMLTGHPVESRLITDFGPALAARAIEAHVTYAGEQADPDVLAAALGDSLSTRLGLTVPVPDLTSFGLRLIGGRLSPADIGPAAFMTYEGPQGERIGFLTTRAPGEDALRFAQGRGASVALWSTAGMGYAVSGGNDKARVMAVAESIRARLTAR